VNQKYQEWNEGVDSRGPALKPASRYVADVTASDNFARTQENTILAFSLRVMAADFGGRGCEQALQVSGCPGATVWDIASRPAGTRRAGNLPGRAFRLGQGVIKVFLPNW